MRRTHARSLRQFLNRHAALAADRAATSTLVHRPVHVYLQIASACNLDCYLRSEHNRPPELRHGVGLESMPRAIHDKVADEVYPYSTMVTFGVGGEPTISPDFPNYLERARRDRQEDHLITNGTRLYREEIAEVVARCASFVQVSVDGATRETYERIRRGAHWSSLREGLATLQRIRARRRLGAPSTRRPARPLVPRSGALTRRPPILSAESESRLGRSPLPMPSIRTRTARGP
jgi:sulfatase maturation enzyme AslB (radical SAM superfamily)